MKSFRLRFNVAARSGLHTEEHAVSLYVDPAGQEVFLRARPEDATIYDAPQLVLKSEGWDSDAAAMEASQKYRDALMFSLAKCRIGADLGDRAAKGFFTEEGLADVARRHGRRALNDEHGVMTFETEPAPLFVSQQLTYKVAIPLDRFRTTFVAAADADLRATTRERLAFEFFTASFFTDYADARFLLLFMAYESLSEQVRRGAVVETLVDELERIVEASHELGETDRTSLLGSLRWLRVESIRQAGKRLAQKVGGKDYNGMSGERLFLASYDVRNRLVHGHAPPPTWEEVGGLAAHLEVLVSDLICERVAVPT